MQIDAFDLSQSLRGGRAGGRFAATVTPCVAMAVSPTEYLLAYMLPFMVLLSSILVFPRTSPRSLSPLSPSLPSLPLTLSLSLPLSASCLPVANSSGREHARPDCSHVLSSSLAACACCMMCVRWERGFCGQTAPRSSLLSALFRSGLRNDLKQSKYKHDS